MCKAMQDWAAEERAKGREEGRKEITKRIIRNMLKRGMSNEEIIELTECTEEMLEEEKKNDLE